MEILQWFFSGMVQLFDAAVSLIAPFFQSLGAAFGVEMSQQTARILAALFLTVFVAWVFRKWFWGKPSMFEPQKIVLKTEKSPFDVVIGEVLHWVGWGLLFVVGLGGLIIAVTGGPP
jgi:hypothetical protein